MNEPSEHEPAKQETWIAPDGEEVIIVHRNYPTPERVGAAILKLIEWELEQEEAARRSQAHPPEEPLP